MSNAYRKFKTNFGEQLLEYDHETVYSSNQRQIKRVLVAYCTSKKCAYSDDFLSKKTVKSYAKRGDIFCKECDSALYWKRVTVNEGN